MLRRLALLSLAFVSGCLYTGTRNDPPSMTVELTPAMGAYRGQIIVAKVDVRDDQNDVATVRQLMKIRLLDVNQLPVADDCTGTVVQSFEGAQLVVYKPGQYWVQVTSSDELGAVSSTSAPLQVIDAPPAFSIGAHPQADAQPNYCGGYTAGQPIAVQLDGSASDPDADPTPPASATCSVIDETLTYTWSIAMAPAGAQAQLGPTVNGSCPASAPAGAGATLTLDDGTAQVCLYTDKNITDAKTGYALIVGVSDGVNPPVMSEEQVPMTVIADQPPCIAGTIPGVGLQVIDRTVPQTFTVTGVVDDLDPYPSASSLLTFAWSVWRTSDPTWRAVAIDDAAYTLDMSGFDVGEEVQVRVAVIDRTGALASCTVDTDQCLEQSCLVGTTQQPNNCLRWTTWSLELR